MKMVDNECRHCGKKFKPRGVGTVLEKKCCSKLCKQRSGAKIYYYAHKNDEGYKEKKKESFNKWLNENRAHFNDLCREPNRIAAYKNYYEFKDLGLCVECGHKRSKHKVKLGYCSAHDWIANMWIECHCTEFVQEASKNGK